MIVTQEDLMAYADGELDGADKARVEAALAAEPALLAVVDRHRAVRARLSAAYEQVIEEPVPGHLLEAARGPTANVVSISAIKDQRTLRWNAREWAAMAAALLVGAIVGAQAVHPDLAIVASNDGLEARGVLARALDTQLAKDEGAVRIGVTFFSGAGDPCRTFVADGGALNGLACRQDGKWRVDMTVRGEVSPATEFRTAATEIPPELLARVDSLIAGAPLDASQEEAARDRRWRKFE